MISFDEALSLLAEAAIPLGVEEVPLAQAHGRVLAEPVVAAISAPPADVSAMDGYAVLDADLAEGPARLKIAGESFAGAGFGGSVKSGECVRIFTGAPVPKGADRVVVQEVVSSEGEWALFEESLGSARHIRKAGSDFAKGDALLARGSLMGPRALIAAAGADVGRLAVFRRPRLSLIATGDELVEPGQAASNPQTIPESVSYGIAALASASGGDVVNARRLPDRLAVMREGAAAALDEADVVVVTGGASVGERDFAKTMFEPHGLKLIFSKVAIKPGKPIWLGRVGKRLVIGLPGNPTSAFVTARLFLVPLLFALAGRSVDEALRWRMLRLAHALDATGPRETFSRAIEAEGEVHLFGHQDSSAQRVLAEATLLVRRAPGTEPLPAGSEVPVLDF